MKKILLSVIMACSIYASQAQTVLNEIYTDPGNHAGRAEVFELYITALVGSQSVECFTILTYWTAGANSGWYVMDLPNMVVASKGFFVGAASNPFNTQSTTGSIPDFSWNDVNFRNGSTGGSLKKMQAGFAGYTDVSGTMPANLNDFLFGGNGNDYIVLVFVNGAFNNGFIGGSGSATLSATIQALPDLPVDMNG